MLLKSYLSPWPNHLMTKGMPKERRIAARIPLDKYPNLEKRWAKCAKIVNVPKSVLVIASLDACLTYIEAHGEVSFPMRLISLEEYSRRVEKFNNAIREAQRKK